MTEPKNDAGDHREPTRSTEPVTQRQEDLLLELFFQISVEERKKVIRYLRDLIQERSAEPGRGKLQGD